MVGDKPENGKCLKKKGKVKNREKCIAAKIEREKKACLDNPVYEI
jgi:hypothetical protein